jgi:hypothetical protein
MSPFFIILYLYYMSLQESIRRILKEETEVPSFIRRRVKLDYIEETLHDVVEIMVKKFRRKSTGYNNVNNFKVMVIVRVLTMELKKKFIDFLFDYYGKDLDDIYKSEVDR